MISETTLKIELWVRMFRCMWLEWFKIWINFHFLHAKILRWFFIVFKEEYTRIERNIIILILYNIHCFRTMKFCIKIRVYVQIYICRAIRFINFYFYFYFVLENFVNEVWAGEKRMHGGKELCILCKKNKKKFYFAHLYKKKTITRIQANRDKIPLVF